MAGTSLPSWALKLGLLLVVLTFLYIGTLVSKQQRDKQSLESLTTRVQKVSSTDVLYQAADAPRGVIYFFHGCKHAALDFFPHSPQCPECTGLPEELAITRAALARNFSVVAVSSSDRSSGCWSSRDLDIVTEVVGYIAKLDGFRNKEAPLFGIGASSGGSFVMHLACQMRFSAISPQIAAMHPSQLEACARSNASTGAGSVYPAVALVHMPRDTLTAERVMSNIKVLESAGVPVQEIQVPPLALDRYFFSERIDAVDDAKSRMIFEVLQKHSLLDDGGHLTKNPRGSEWRSALIEGLGAAAVDRLGVEADRDSLPEELNVAYAQHEFTADVIADVLDFFMRYL